MCIFNAAKCDSFADCIDGSDEKGCGRFFFAMLAYVHVCMYDVRLRCTCLHTKYYRLISRLADEYKLLSFLFSALFSVAPFVKRHCSSCSVCVFTIPVGDDANYILINLI